MVYHNLKGVWTRAASQTPAEFSDSSDQGHTRMQGRLSGVYPMPFLIRVDRRRRTRLDQARVRGHTCFLPRGRLLCKT